MRELAKGDIRICVYYIIRKAELKEKEEQFYLLYTMHSHLIPHKHPGCLDIMLALEACHARGFLHKAVGSCNDIKRQVNLCFAEERKEKVRAHREVAMEKRRKQEEKWREIDENS